MPSSAANSAAALGDFQTTHWSLVIAACGKESHRSDEALTTLCRNYWPPIYSYLRRLGHSVHAAEDLTQEFFARLLEKNFAQTADRERGRFRSFLLGALKHFLANVRKAARAQKRGGGKATLSLDFRAAEESYQLEPADERTPQMLFEQRWALLLLDRVFSRLESESAAAGKAAQFARLQLLLIVTGEQPLYREIAAELGISEAAVKMAVRRLRQRYRVLLREEIAQTVADPAEIDDELRQLFAALAQK